MDEVPTGTAARDPGTQARPGWAELVVAIVATVVLYSAAITLSVVVPVSTPALEGVMQLGLTGLAPVLVFAIVVLVRIRDVRAFGVRRAGATWLLAGAGLAVGCLAVILTFDAVVAALYPGVDDNQGQLRAAATGGVPALVGTLVLGGLLTPLGEELLFRGVLARFLQRWGTVVAVVLSACVFAAFHGINLVLPSAFVVGLCCGWLLCRSGSVWPGVVLHTVYNTSFLLIYSGG